MECVADRFAATMSGEFIDLATGERVLLSIASAGGETEQRQWAIRCDLFQKLHHPAIASLLDYGAVGESRRFEAWRCTGPWPGSEVVAAHARDAAAAFLRACGLTLDSTGPGRVHQCRSQPLVVPAAGSGYAAADPQGADGRSLPLERCGLLHIERPITRAIAELFDDHSCTNDVVAIVGPVDAGKTAVVEQLARAARLRGFVPIAVHLLDTPFASAIDGRSALLIDDEASDGVASLLDAVMRSPRRHILLMAAREDLRGVPCIALQRLTAQALIGAVVPPAMSDLPRVQRAAARANGLPGSFVHLLRGSCADRRTSPSTSTRAAERTPVYGGEEPAPAVFGREGVKPLTTWPAPGELAALRRQMETALSQLRSGRHAPGERGLRCAIGGLARRGIWTTAADGSQALASSLLKRGRPRDALAVLDAARDYSRRAGDGRALLPIATLSGVALTDLARLDEASNVLTAATAAASVKGDVNAAASVGIALARCRFWRAEYGDANSGLRSLTDAQLRDADIVRLRAIQSRVSIGCGELSTAIEAAVEAVQRASSLGDAALIAEATCAAAFAHLAAGDLPALQRDAAACVSAARAARDPLRAFRVHLALAEQLRRLGRRHDALATLRSVNRASASSLPPIIRRRREMLMELLGAGTPVVTVMARYVTGSGLPGLGLFLPRERPSPANVVALPAMLEGAVETLRLCQDAADDRVTLTAVCGHIQRQLHAAAVAFFGVERGALTRLACNGVRVEPAIAERAMAAAAVIAPHRIDEQIEAAAPVRYGGSTIGAVAVRWALGASPDPVRAVAAMTVATTAAGPIVAAMLAARQRSEPARATGLTGVTPAMVDVRHTVERAALSPFAVLIEGESGSGKELVAREVHRASSRRDRPFCTLNCAALPDELVESELFGHARGAFTGAVGERIGVFEEAHTGTLLLDEVGELSPRAQAKVLRVIQEGELRRIGENVSRRIDVRIVSATNRDLRQEVSLGRFRLDLLYRLDVVRIVVPPLRDRRDDIPPLVDRLWRDAAARVGSRATLSAPTIAALAQHEWPGNVRELQNVLAALAVRVARRGVVPPTALPPHFGNGTVREACRLDEARRLFDERFVRAALARTGGRRSLAASELGLTRQGLAKLMTRLGLVDGAL